MIKLTTLILLSLYILYCDELINEPKIEYYGSIVPDNYYAMAFLEFLQIIRPNPNFESDF